VAKRLLIIIFSVLSIAAKGQEVVVSGYFMQDSAKLGERVGYVLKASHPESKQLIFPDSVYNFGALVLLEKQTFISKTAEGFTLDSAIYFLSNFSLEPSIFLSLPVYELARYDSVTYFPLEDAELKLKLTLDSIPEQPIFQENNVYQPLNKPINWIVTSLLIGGILLLMGVFYFLFNKKITGFFTQLSEKRRWKKFEKKWKLQTAELAKTPSIELADEVIGLWKGYLESITKQPIKEWTSSEIGEKLEDPKIFNSLRAIDMIIYAGVSSKSEEASAYLFEVAKEKFDKKISKTNHDRTAV
jgi:hypothetical protein